MKCEIIEIREKFIRLDALLKFSGAAQTGGQAKIMISEGNVRVNGVPCEVRGKKLYNGDEVAADGGLYKIESLL